MNSYKVQYWLYAIFAKQFKNEVRMDRSSLHSRYAVNRHDFTVSSNSIAPSVLRKFVDSELIKSQYQREESRYKMELNNKEFNVFIYETKTGLAISIFSYKRIPA